jgi:hypothetical protein
VVKELFYGQPVAIKKAPFFLPYSAVEMQKAEPFRLVFCVGQHDQAATCPYFRGVAAG